MTNLPRDDEGKLESYAWPGGYAIVYLDSEDSLMCPDCANKSDNAEEVPQFRPVRYIVLETFESDYCDQCSKEIK